MAYSTRKLLIGLAAAALALGGFLVVRSGESESEPSLEPPSRTSEVAAGRRGSPHELTGSVETEAEAEFEQGREVAQLDPRALEPRILQPPDDALWVEGRVILPAGTPVDEQPQVLARGRRFSGSGGASREHAATPDAEGRFRVAFAVGTRKGWIDLVARYLYLEERVRLNPKAPEDELLVRPLLGGRIVGRALLPTGEAPPRAVLRGARARLEGHVGGQYVSRLAGLDHEGRFELTGLQPDGGYRLRIESRLFAGGVLTAVEVRAGETTSVEVACLRGVRVSGRVLGPDGVGVARAQVEIRPLSEPDQLPVFRIDAPFCKTSEDGSFELAGLQPGSMRFRAAADGYALSSGDLGPYEDGDELEELVIELRKGGFIAGRVVWPDGSPAAGASLLAIQPWDAEHWSASETAPGSRELRAIADEHGEFRIEGLGRSLLTLEASARHEPEAVVEDQEGGGRKSGRGGLWRCEPSEHRPGSFGLVLVLEQG